MSPYTPDESSSQLFAEKTWLHGAILTGIAYGAMLVLSFTCTHMLLQGRGAGARNMSRLRRNALLGYVLFVTIIGTLFMAGCAAMTQLSFIDNRDFPGGPANYEETMFSIPIDEIGNVAFVLANWCADAMLVWRSIIIYQGCGLPPWLVIFIPCLMYLGSFAMSIMWLIQISSPSSSPFQTSATNAINWTEPYLFLSLALNIVLTILIVSRLLLHRHKLRRLLGAKHGSDYTSIASLIVESSALYSSFSLLFLIPFALNSALANIFLQALSQVQIIAPLLIIYRVLQGKAWSSETATIATTRSVSTGIPLDSLHFKTPSSNASTGFTSHDTRDDLPGKNSQFTVVNVAEDIYVETHINQPKKDHLV